jgi:SPX domain protein involved in polyphosphate accumulation
MSFRKERKFRLTYYQAQKLKAQLYSNGLEILHPKRQVTSIYFDTSKFDMFCESEEGVMPRKKIRIRWYDEQINFTKETKISSIEGRFKTTIKNCDFANEEEIRCSTLFEPTYGLLKPVLKVSYSREYFQLNRMRLTIDSNICYENLGSIDNMFMKDPEQVMELKIPDFLSDDYYQQVIPYPTTRFSKYCRGILLSCDNKKNFI